MFNQNFYLWVLGIIVIGISVNSVQTANLRLYKNSLDDYVTVSLKEADKLACDPSFNPNVTTVFYAFGFMSSPDADPTKQILNAYINSNKTVNLILVDWEEEAQSGPLGEDLGYAMYTVPNTLKVGNELGEALMALKKAGVDLNKTHLVGHTLGAYVIGFAGQYLKSKGITLPRITGLDPAGPIYDGPYPKNIGLSRDDAETVVIIHSDPGKFGTDKSRGTANFRPNPCGEQPGCKPNSFPELTPEGTCSHFRSVPLFCESVILGNVFLASAAKDHNEWLTLKTLPENVAYMGDSTDASARGNYYLRTNAEWPFGKGQEGALPEQSNT